MAGVSNEEDDANIVAQGSPPPNQLKVDNTITGMFTLILEKMEKLIHFEPL